MKKFILPILASFLLFACEKNADHIPDWIEKKKAEYSRCTCLIEFQKGRFQGTTVYEIRVTDPLCNGINVVYKEDGTIWFTSSPDGLYAKYLKEVTELKKIWSCEDQHETH